MQLHITAKSKAQAKPNWPCQLWKIKFAGPANAISAALSKSYDQAKVAMSCLAADKYKDDRIKQVALKNIATDIKDGMLGAHSFRYLMNTGAKISEIRLKVEELGKAPDSNSGKNAVLHMSELSCFDCNALKRLQGYMKSNYKQVAALAEQRFKSLRYNCEQVKSWNQRPQVSCDARGTKTL